jgi:hypothetical protein
MPPWLMKLPVRNPDNDASVILGISLENFPWWSSLGMGTRDWWCGPGPDDCIVGEPRSMCRREWIPSARAPSRSRYCRPIRAKIFVILSYQRWEEAIPIRRAMFWNWVLDGVMSSARCASGLRVSSIWWISL